MVFTGKTLDGILGKFSKTVKELEAYVSSKKVENTNLKQTIAQAEETVKVNDSEITRANKVIENINKLIG